MKKSDHLFQLINSLSKSEKRYFKLSTAMQKGEKVYLKLFNVIENQKEYDQQKVRQSFGNSTIIKQLPTYKNYLYQLILKSLNQYHLERSISKKIKEGLFSIEILLEKGLYDQCYKLLLKTKRVAYEHEKHTQLMDVLYLERKLLARRSFYKDKTNKKSEELFEEMDEVLKKIENYNQYSQLIVKIFSFHYKNYSIRSPLQKKEIEDLMANPLLKDESKALSFDTKTIFYDIHAIYCLMINDEVGQYNYSKKLVALMENPPIKTANKQVGVISLVNFILTQVAVKKYKGALETIAKLKLIVIKIIPLIEVVYYTIYIAELHIFRKYGEFDKGIDLINKINLELKSLPSPNDKMAEIKLYFEIANLYFEIEEYHNSLKWLNKLFNDTKLDLRQDIQSAARILNLIVHYELGNNNLLEYIVKSTYRFLYKRNQLYQSEQSILDFLRKKLPQIKTQKDLINEFKNLKNELEKISKTSLENKTLTQFDLTVWLESKIENQSLAKMIKKRAKKYPSIDFI